VRCQVAARESFSENCGFSTIPFMERRMRRNTPGIAARDPIPTRDIAMQVPGHYDQLIRFIRRAIME